MQLRILLFLFSLFGLALTTAESTHAAAPNDFAITDYHIKYTLARDDAQRAILSTTETITAKFPNSDQNHGLERYLPRTYNGHPISLHVTSVKNAAGDTIEYSTDTQNDTLRLRIGDPDVYVHGLQTYVITYTQRDVTQHFASSSSDEFYWDTNGTDWQVPIANFRATLNIDPTLAPSLTGNTACYKGSSGSTERCELHQQATLFRTEATSLPQGHNITLAIGFEQGTFAPYEKSLLETLVEYWLVLQAGLLIISIGVVTWLSVRYYKWSNRSNEQHPIAPEYTAPKHISVTTAASLLDSTNSFGAQLIDLAVRHFITIHQTKEKTFWTSAEYEIEIHKDISPLREEEKELLTDLYGHLPKVGERFALKSMRTDTKIYSRLQDNPAKLSKLMQGSYGLRHRSESHSQWLKKAALVLLVSSVVLLSPPLLIASLVAFGLKSSLWPLTDEGLAVVRYLKGLKLYTGVAETERLKMLQSPEGAQKTGIKGEPTNRKLIKLYERTLPYAVLFGQEKEWNKQLGRYYESAGQQPDWYSGVHSAAFSATAFSSAMSSFTTAHGSSSSGGSTGGGYSGGGGGGGGGGGW